MRNTTDQSNANFNHDYEAWLTADKVVISLSSGLGVPFSLWLILCLCSSWELPSRLAGRLMTSSLLASLLDLGVLAILHLAFYILEHDCMLLEVSDHLMHMQDFIFNWTLVLLLIVYVAQLKDFDPSRQLTPRKHGLLAGALVVMPWLIGALMYPVASHVHDYYICPGSSASKEVYVLVVMATRLVPALLTLVLAGVAVFSRRRNDQLSNRSVDPVLPYVLIAATMSYDIPFTIVIDVLGMSHFDLYAFWTILIFGQMNDKVKDLLTPAIFLLLPDVRGQACDVTLRLWRRATGMCGRRVSPGSDLTVIYSNKIDLQPDEMGSSNIELQ